MAFHLTSSHTLLAISSLLGLVMNHRAAAVVYNVGDDDGWINGRNYLLWSEQHNFTVGDVLFFKYVKGQHNVYQVTEKTYRTCDPSAGVVRTYSTGGDRVDLTEVARYWFICNIKGHCKGGMKLSVNVTSAKGSSQGGGGGTTDPELTQPPPPVVVPAAAGGRMGWWGCGVVAVGLLHLVNY